MWPNRRHPHTVPTTSSRPSSASLLPTDKFQPAWERQQLISDCYVELVGAIKGQTERLYAISVECRLKHPAVVAIEEAARETLFGSVP